MSIFDEEQKDIFHFGVDDTASAYLQETARWTKFLAILAMIGLGLLISVGFFYFSGLTDEPDPYAVYNRSRQTLSTVTFLILVLVNVYPTIELLRFSNNVRDAIEGADRKALQQSVRQLRNLFRYLGILSAVVLGIYAVFFLFSSVRSFF